CQLLMQYTPLLARMTVPEFFAVIFLFFLFQEEAGIRDKLVTGVQTCALPICTAASSSARCGRTRCRRWSGACGKIGRASCRARVEISVVAVSIKRKRMET